WKGCKNSHHRGCSTITGPYQCNDEDRYQLPNLKTVAQVSRNISRAPTFSIASRTPLILWDGAGLHETKVAHVGAGLASTEHKREGAVRLGRGLNR
ncbi:MAG: hypothetical protein Q8K28_21860, partial [Hoeflea sp.]|uniref:hypothetical protein n=1 Tax=Hoeflea sp. TaxID=1940281 RepID=UPI002730902F